jgi:hypothetical protein
MTTTLRVSLALVLGFATFAAGAQPARQPMVVRTTATYSCGSSPAGGCAFLLYTSDCKEAGVKNGHPSLLCTHEVFAEFRLKPGESKTFDSMPPGVKQCQPRNGRLVFPECMQ